MYLCITIYLSIKVTAISERVAVFLVHRPNWKKWSNGPCQVIQGLESCRRYILLFSAVHKSVVRSYDNQLEVPITPLSWYQYTMQFFSELTLCHFSSIFFLLILASLLKNFYVSPLRTCKAVHIIHYAVHIINYQYLQKRKSQT